MPSKTKAATSLAEAAVAIAALPQGARYKNAAALLEAAAPGTAKHIGTSVRKVLRDNAEKVGRGKEYKDLTPGHWGKVYKAQQAAKASAKSEAQAKKASSKEKAKA